MVCRARAAVCLSLMGAEYSTGGADGPTGFAIAAPGSDESVSTWRLTNLHVLKGLDNVAEQLSESYAFFL